MSEKENYNEGEIELFIREVFRENYELMRLEFGSALSPSGIAEALQHVLFYWKKMKDVAESVTDTEVRLTLPQQETPQERDFTIEGVVDIVRDDDRTIMYDIKTHSVDTINANIEQYEQQLNIYAHIWQELRKESLDQAAVICTDIPNNVQHAYENGDIAGLEIALKNWEPLIEIDYDRRRVDETIKAFGEIVDKIEENHFAPPALEVLKDTIPGSKKRFAVHVCRNCDSRFSCTSYRAYARQGKGRAEQNFRRYYQELDVLEAQESWRTANLDAAPNAEDLLKDFGV
jgi:hypothetical protein